MNNKNAPKTKPKHKPKRVKRNKLPKKFVGGLFFFVVFYVIMCLVCVLFLSLRIALRRRDPAPDNAKIIVVTQKIDEKTSKTQTVKEKLDTNVVKSVAKQQKSAYVPVSIFEMLGEDITPAGDPIRSITVNLNNAGESASFRVNSDKANVNGMDITLKAQNVLLDGELYIPVDFFESQLRGISVAYDNGEYVIQKNDIENISFVNKPAFTTPYIEEDDYFDDEPIKFKADLSRYEQYMNPENRDDFLYVVNVNNLLDEDFVPEDLRDVKYTKPDRAKQQMSLNAQMAADAMMIEAREYGHHNLWVTSAYRSYQTQSWLYQDEVNSLRDEYGDMAEEKAKESVNPPGASEHQTGLTADIHTLSTASMQFAGTAAAEWLEENAQYFGFILRYPEDKTEITGIMYEPWHFRYVGRYHAMQIKRLGMCLEEYMEYLKTR